MKKVLVLLLSLGIFSAGYSYSCSGSAFYDISRDYVTKKDGIYYEYSYKTTQNNNGKMELIPNVTESSKVTGADAATFEKINKFLGKDKKNLYYKNKVIGKSEGFESIGAYYTYKPCTSPEDNYIIKNTDRISVLGYLVLNFLTDMLRISSVKFRWDRKKKWLKKFHQECNNI